MTRQEKLLYLLGYAVPFVLDYQCFSKEEEDKKLWLLQAIKEVIYFDRDIPLDP